MTKNKVLVSITSIPRRIDVSLPKVLEGLKNQKLDFDLLVTVPRSYRKWGEWNQAKLEQIKSLATIHICDEDYGPATKLLGALEFAVNKDYDKIITLDDDIYPSNPNYLNYLDDLSDLDRNQAWTLGGIKLLMPPYHSRFGLWNRNSYTFADAVSGYRGVVYPARKLVGSSMPFNLLKEVPSGAYSEDDAYFGAMLFKLGIKIIAARPHPNSPFVGSDGGASAIDEKTSISRRDNEGMLFKYFVQHGMIGHGIIRSGISSEIKREAKEIYLRYKQST